MSGKDAIQKSKRQLRAEAVARLEDTRMDTGGAVKKLAMALGSEWNPPSVNYSLGCMKSRLIYLLTDDEPPEGDAVSIIRNSVAAFNDGCEPIRGIVETIVGKQPYMLPMGAEADALNALADMVERDYVRRKVHERAGEIWSSTVEEWRKRCESAEAERDEWKTRAEVLERECEEFQGISSEESGHNADMSENSVDGVRDEKRMPEVEHPTHYTSGGVECIDAIKSALTPEEFRGYCKGNALKYVWRERLKGGDVDMQKAEWYLRRIGGCE